MSAGLVERPVGHPHRRQADADRAGQRRLPPATVAALAGRALPLRPHRALQPVWRDLDWQDRAACRDVGREVSDVMLDATAQTDAVYLAGRFCAACPAVVACLTFGRATHASGLWGAVVLRGGQVAPQSRSSPDSIRRTEALAGWLASHGGRFEGTAEELHRALDGLGAWGSPVAFRIWLGKSSTPLEDAGITATSRPVGAVRVWTLEASR